MSLFEDAMEYSLTLLIKNSTMDMVFGVAFMPFFRLRNVGGDRNVGGRKIFPLVNFPLCSYLLRIFRHWSFPHKKMLTLYCDSNFPLLQAVISFEQFGDILPV
jgi:hypothetical protein